MSTRKFTKEHEWVNVEDNIGTIGITNHGQHHLGSIALVMLPNIGKVAEQGKKILVLESAKTASEIYAPVSGTIVEVNLLLTEQPELVNNDPEQQGWLCKIKISNPKELNNLFNEQEYQAFLASQ